MTKDKYKNRYAVVVEQRADDLGCPHSLTYSLELRMLKAKDQKEAIQVAKKLMNKILGMRVCVRDVKNNVWREKAEWWPNDGLKFPHVRKN